MISHDSWQRIKEIFQSAQELKPEERSDFLDHACGDDKSLREEVEALLTADASNEDFLIAPAYEFAASIIAGEETEFSPGEKIGAYKILCPLGSGGMGQIYLAEDAKLRRKIALKFISPQFAADPQRVMRFEQEALAASALNHPNICVIHELGQTENDRHFIAMEYIQGITLRDQLSRGRLPVKQALNIAIQVATALSSAHASRIVHRDIKPENIMLRPDGYVKVLDFGLAKLTEILPVPETLLLGSKNVATEAGTLMGTVKYMSPEQLRETKVDERSDIWSLGVVLYEMLKGSTPFEAPTPNETVAAIRAAQPPSLEFPDHVPGELRSLITRALEKERDRRYQTISKFASDLKKLQAKLQGQTTVDPPGAYPFTGDEQQTRKIEPSGIFTRLKTQALLTTDFLLTEIRSHKTAALFTGVSGVLVFLLMVPSLVRVINGLVNRPSLVTPIQMKPVTNEGNSICSTISPDGSLIAYAEEKDGKQRLVVTNTATSVQYIAVPPEDVQYLGASFTRDNGYLFFTRKESGAGILYRQALPHSLPVKIKDGVDSPISFSPQQDRFAFVRLDGKTGVYSLVLSNIDGSNEQVIATRTGGNMFSISGLAWSPDGDLIVCPTRSWTDSGYQVHLTGFDLKTGHEQQIGPQSWFSIFQVSWQDMSSLIISARDDGTSPFQLWRITYPEGTIHKITNDLAEYWGASVSGQNIVTVRTEWRWGLFVVNTADNYAPHSPILSGVGLNYGIAWAGNDQIVFSSMAQDKLNISRINDDGSNQVQLTMNAGNNYTPETSADGRFVVFASNRNGKYNIWRMNTQDGGDLKQLTFTDGNFYPSISPDNQWVAYDNQSSTTKDVWKVPLEGGTPTKVTEKYRMPAYSPDSRMIAVRYDLTSGTRDVAILSGEAGQVLRQVQIPVLEWQRVRWLSNHTLSYVKSVDGEANIWSYDLNTGAETRLTNFNRNLIYAYAWSPDYKKLACQLGSGVANVVVVKE
jgi:eukaryotic-like serine/threonine-protein kinase